MRKTSPLDTTKLISETIEEFKSRRFVIRPSKTPKLGEVRKFSKRDRENEFLVENKVIELMSLLIKYEYFPEVYRELYECLCMYTHPKDAILNELLRKMSKYFADDFAERTEPKKSKHRIQTLEKKIEGIKAKSKSSKEYIYNYYCEALPYPNMTYKELHEFLLNEKGFSKETLRQYKRRRKIRTGDFREDLPISNDDVKKIKNIFIEHDYRITMNDLMDSVKWNKDKLEMILQKMKREGRISYSKARTNTGIENVIVLNS